MFWIFLLITVLIILGGYVTYKEAKHHQVKELRVELETLEEKHRDILEEAEKNDPDMADYFRGELVGIQESLDIVKKADEEYDTIQEIKDDIERLWHKVFKKKDGEVA